MTDEKRTLQIGVRVTKNELERIKLRAKAFTPFSPMRPASFLRKCALDAQPDPSPQLIEKLDQVIEEFKLARGNLYDDPAINKHLKEAKELLRQIIERVG